MDDGTIFVAMPLALSGIRDLAVRPRYAPLEGDHPRDEDHERARLEGAEHGRGGGLSRRALDSGLVREDGRPAHSGARPGAARRSGRDRTDRARRRDVRHSHTVFGDEAAAGMVLGTLSTALGVAFLLAAATSYTLSQRWGLLEKRG